MPYKKKQSINKRPAERTNNTVVLKRTEVEMRQLLDRFSLEKESVHNFCKRHSLTLFQYHYWRRKLGYRFSRKNKADKSGFIRLLPHHRPDSLISNNSESYEVVSPDGIRIRVAGILTSDSLCHILSAVRG